MTRLDRIRISRKEFVGLGLSAALLSSGATPFVAKAKTVNFMAATTGTLSRYCKGDGSDETAMINHVFANNLFVEVDEPPASVGYGFRAQALNDGIVLRSGHEINGRGANAKLLRVGKFSENGKALRNGNSFNGDRSIKLNNLYINGFRNRPDVPDTVGESPSVGIAIRANDTTKFCENIQLTGIQVHNWPGTAIRVVNASNLALTDVKTVNPLRVGIQINTSKHVDLLRVLSADTGDDAIAFSVAGEPTNRPMTDVTLDGCESYTRENPRWGAALKLLGLHGALVTNSKFTHAKNTLVTLASYPGFGPTDIQVNDNRMLGGLSSSFEVVADKASGISARRNYMHHPDAFCVHVATWDGRAANLDVTVTDNTLSKPGFHHHIDVQGNLSGVYTKGNKLIYEYTVPPTLKLIEPKPGPSVRQPVKRIEALANASVTRRNNELRKSDVSLFINGQRVSSFDYYSSGKVIKTSPKLRRGSNTVKVSFKYIGRTSSKSWTFNVK